jgi:LacI family transcriptional regulator
MTDTSIIQPARSIKGRATIAQIARAAGVSISTVSHAFSGKRPISERLRKQIFSIAEQSGYRPHFAAQALATRKTHTIGVLSRQATEQYFPQHLEGIAAAASERGYMLSVGLTGGNPVAVQKYLDAYAHGQVDGALITTADVTDGQIIELATQGVAVITPLRRIAGHDDLMGVDMNMGPIFHKMLEYLYSMGHRQFGFVCGVPEESPERYDTMQAFLRDRGLDLTTTRQMLGVQSSEDAQSAAVWLMRRHPEITAIVCSSDMLAVGGVMASHELGLRVPGDVSITGFDDMPISRLCIPRLTTVRIPVTELSAMSVHALLDRIEGKPPTPPRSLSLELLIRESTGTPRTHSLRALS